MNETDAPRSSDREDSARQVGGTWCTESRRAARYAPGSPAGPGRNDAPAETGQRDDLASERPLRPVGHEFRESVGQLDQGSVVGPRGS
jgi:hypothetical protein